MSEGVLGKAIDGVQTSGGLIALLILVSGLIVFLLIVVTFNLQITLKPFSIKRANKNIDSGKLSQLDINNLVSLIKDAYSIFEYKSKEIHNEYTEKINRSGKSCISSLVNNILIEYSNIVEKKTKMPAYDNSDVGILELYLERDVNDVILDVLKDFYDDDLTQAQIENLIEHSIQKIVFELKGRLIKYRLIKDQASLRTIYDDSPKYIAQSLRDAFRNFSTYAKEERDEIEKLVESRNEDLNNKLKFTIQGGDEANGNGTNK